MGIEMEKKTSHMQTKIADLQSILRMERTYLIQRLEIPYGEDYDNPFTFGAGMRHGGLQDDTFRMLNGIFSFSYMGAAQYEFGAIPRSLGAIAEQAEKGNLTSGKVVVNNSQIKKAEVFYICREAIEEGVKEIIKKLAQGESWHQRGEKIRTRDFVGLNNVLKDGKAKEGKLEPGDLAGWLELDNDFMFFADKKMFEKTAVLFGLRSQS